MGSQCDHPFPPSQCSIEMFFPFYFYVQKKSVKRDTVGAKINALQGGESEVIKDLLGQSSDLFRIFFVSKSEGEIADDPLSVLFVEVEGEDSHDLRKEDHALQGDPSKQEEGEDENPCG